MFWIGETCRQGQHRGNAEEREREIAFTHDQVRHDNLQYLCFEAGPACEDLLEEGDHDVAERSADKGTIYCHLGDATGKVVPVLVAVFCDPRGEKLLQRGERA